MPGTRSKLYMYVTSSLGMCALEPRALGCGPVGSVGGLDSGHRRLRFLTQNSLSQKQRRIPPLRDQRVGVLAKEGWGQIRRGPLTQPLSWRQKKLRGPWRKQFCDSQKGQPEGTARLGNDRQLLLAERHPLLPLTPLPDMYTRLGHPGLWLN